MIERNNHQLNNLEMSTVEIEKTHFEHEHKEKFTDKEVKTSSNKILKILEQIKNYAFRYQDYSKGFLKLVKQLFDRFSLELRLRLLVCIIKFTLRRL